MSPLNCWWWQLNVICMIQLNWPTFNPSFQPLSNCVCICSGWGVGWVGLCILLFKQCQIVLPVVFNLIHVPDSNFINFVSLYLDILLNMDYRADLVSRRFDIYNRKWIGRYSNSDWLRRVVVVPYVHPLRTTGLIEGSVLLWTPIRVVVCLQRNCWKLLKLIRNSEEPWKRWNWVNFKRLHC